jgi:hypothetical protein
LSATPVWLWKKSKNATPFISAFVHTFAASHNPEALAVLSRLSRSSLDEDRQGATDGGTLLRVSTTAQRSFTRESLLIAWSPDVTVFPQDLIRAMELATAIQANVSLDEFLSSPGTSGLLSRAAAARRLFIRRLHPKVVKRRLEASYHDWLSHGDVARGLRVTRLHYGSPLYLIALSPAFGVVAWLARNPEKAVQWLSIRDRLRERRAEAAANVARYELEQEIVRDQLTTLRQVAIDEALSHLQEGAVEYRDVVAEMAAEPFDDLLARPLGALPPVVQDLRIVKEDDAGDAIAELEDDWFAEGHS